MNSIIFTYANLLAGFSLSYHLMFGWEQGSLLNQLAIANESLGGGTVVVMAERDKEEMELDIAKMEFDFKGTSVICRSGSPLILADLKKVIFFFFPVHCHVKFELFSRNGVISACISHLVIAR